MTLDASGNLGLGVTPSAWASTFKVLQIGTTSLYRNLTTDTFLGSNFYFDGSNNRYIQTSSASAYGQVGDSHQWFTAASGTAGDIVSFLERMRIDSSGQVGIGTSSPDANLTVNGAASFAAGTALLPSIARAGDLNTGFWFPAADTIAASTAGLERMRVDANGNVLVGTTSAALGAAGRGNIEISGSSTSLLGLKGGSNQVYLFNDGTDLFVANGAASGNIVFQPASTVERMRINSSGNVVIGTTTALVSAGGRGNITLNGATDSVIAFGISAALSAYLYSTAERFDIDATGARIITFRTNSLERMRIASDGIVTMSAYGAGAATFSASGVISSVSDETWKIKDGVPTNPDEMLQKLEPGYWFYNEEKAPIFGADRQLGFYAQNVNEAIGNEAAPTPEEGKPWGYYDRSVLAITVMSLQNALQKIEELNAKFDDYVASHP
jgi:hypothetical protein